MSLTQSTIDKIVKELKGIFPLYNPEIFDGSVFVIIPMIGHAEYSYLREFTKTIPAYVCVKPEHGVEKIRLIFY